MKFISTVHTKIDLHKTACNLFVVCLSRACKGLAWHKLSLQYVIRLYDACDKLVTAYGS